MRRWSEITGALFVSLLAAIALPADEHHEGDEIPCSDCHSMHFGEVTFEREPLEPGGPYPHLLLLPEDELCLSCHDGTDPLAPNVLGPDGATLSGGWFSDMAGALAGSGHTPGSMEPPPGSALPGPGARLLCTSCHDPHGNPYYRNLRPDPAGIPGLALTYQKGATGPLGASVRIDERLGDSRFSPGSILFGTFMGTGSGVHVSDWCGACHDRIAGAGGDSHMGGSPSGDKSGESPWLQHPVKGIPLSLSVANGHDESRVWFEPHASRLEVATRGDIPGSPGESDNEITCTSCHAAHGSGHPYSLVYDDPQTALPRDGARVSQACEECHLMGLGGFLGTPHGDPDTGAEHSRALGERGDCTQCHMMHGGAETGHTDGGSYPFLLLSEPGNGFCYGGSSAGGCHREKTFGYPAGEEDRMPEYAAMPGYFEYNVGGVRKAGLTHRKRWPGEQAFSSPLTFGSGRFFSPHAYDPDMPERDQRGEGTCGNCHDAHSSPDNPDLLVLANGPISGSGEARAPARYALCLSCHSPEGPLGMDPENQRIRDYYDPSINDDETAGHQVRFNRKAAISWPSNVTLGDKLPCYDCHNPHGSFGHRGTRPNGFLLSDERPEWEGLTDTLGDAEQSRRFCTGCHIPSDGAPGAKTVEGIVMNAISARQGHASDSPDACHRCHGGDYSGSTSYNVHHPAGGSNAGKLDEEVH